MKNFVEIDKLLDKYWAGDSSLTEERQLRDYFQQEVIDSNHEPFRNLFDFFKQESEVKFDGKIESQINRSKRRPLTFRTMSVAASIILLVGVSIVMFKFVNVDKSLIKTHDTWAKYEVEDPEEAKAKAVAALAFLSSKLQKGENNVKQHMKMVGKMPIH
jgi:hypothetical protein